MILTGIDIETTGIDYQKGHKIIQICMDSWECSDLKLGGLRKISRDILLVNPMRAIEKGAFEVHGISLHSLKAEPVWKTVAPKVADVLGKADLIIAHNAEFDIPFVVHELLSQGQPIPNCNVFCTMVNSRNATAMGKWPNLGELCNAYDVEYDPEKAHDAGYDVEVMMDCFFAGVRRGYFWIEGEAA